MGEQQFEKSACAILPFRRLSVARPGKAAVGLHAGDIVFFTGIRYARDDADGVSGPESGPHGVEGDGTHSSRPGGKRRRRA